MARKIYVRIGQIFEVCPTSIMTIKLGHKMKVVQRKVLAVLLMLPLCGVAMVRAEPLDAVASDPSGMGWMQGFPPPEDRMIGHPASDYFSFPKLRWTF